jgi:thiol-disulfide isomerase/thioredoxin
VRAFLAGLLIAAVGLGACSKPSPGAPPAPFERLESLDAIRQLARPQGRPRLVHFWALWCPACMEELPRQVALAHRAKAAGAEVVLVDADGYGKEAEVRAHLSKLGALDAARHALLNMELDPDSVTAVFTDGWHGSLPATFAYRSSGEQSFKVIGPLPPEQEPQLLRAISP